MMSIGHATAHNLHAMQRSNEKRNIPRNRLAGSRRSSGYRIVTFGRNSSRIVVFRPSSMSRTRNRSLQLGFGYSTCMHPLRFRFHVEDHGAKRGDADPVHQPFLSGQNEDRSDEDVSERERNHPLPAEVHQLVEAEAGEGRAKPDV